MLADLPLAELRGYVPDVPWNEQGKDLLAWLPKVEGRFRVWVSWGCGWPTHTHDARYILDRDGNSVGELLKKIK